MVCFMGTECHFLLLSIIIIDDDDGGRHGSSSATNTTYCYSIPLMYPVKTKGKCTSSLVNNQSAYICELWL